MHGSNPHGQGTGAIVDLSPSDTNPLDPNDSGEDVFVGDSRGEQNPDGTYHGSVTALHALGLENLLEQLVPGLTMIQTNPGEDKVGALDSLNNGLNALCTANLLCLRVLDMHSTTDATSSHNSFSAASVGIPLLQTTAGVLESHGDISHNPTTGCQTSHGDSHVANASIIGTTVTGSLIGANTIQGSSDSTACPDGTQTVTQTSGVLGLTGALAFLNDPVSGANCEAGQEDNLSVLGLGQVLSALGVLALPCNSNDQNSGVTSSPYGVREGLTAFVLPAAGLVKATLAGPESHAVAQPAAVPPTTPTSPTGPGNNKKGNKGNKGKGGNNGGNGGAGGGAGAAAGAAAAGNGQLAFTGADLLILGLVGGALILGGLALTTTAGRRHRRTV